MPKQIPCLWFDGQAEEAAQHYTSIFPNSSIGDITRYGPDMPPPMKEGDVLTVDFTLDGQPYTALNGGPQFPFNEVDLLPDRVQGPGGVRPLLDRLTDGGEESMCGWLKDKFGVSWQVFPDELIRADQRPRPRPGAAGHPGDAADAPHRHRRDQARRRQRLRLSPRRRRPVCAPVTRDRRH